MTIRKTLLIAFLFVSLGPLIVLTYLGYVKTKEAMQTEIEQSLAVQAATLSADIDKTLFERLQNMETWNRLEVMQDIRIADVDKRLSNFLVQLKAGYAGVYTELYCTDASGKIVAASDSALLGQTPQRQPVWLRSSVSEGSIILETPVPSAAGQPARLVLRSPVPSAFDGASLGELTLVFDWSQVESQLNQATKRGQLLAVLDRSGRVIAASTSLRVRKWMDDSVFRSWLAPDTDNKTAVRSGAPLWHSDVIVAFDRSSGFEHFGGFGWTTLIVQPLGQALIPIHKMAVGLLSIVSVAILITIGVSTWVSRAIASPIIGLTQFTRRFASAQALPDPPAAGGEVGELTSAFVQLVRDIDESKQKLVRASMLAAVGEMAAAIAHEVRTPLGILRSSAQMLKREPNISAEGYELSEFIDSETGRLNRLVSAMLDSARPRAPDFKPTDLHALIHNSIALLQAQTKNKAVQVTAVLGDIDPVCEADAEQITQVMLNLLLNALQVLPKGGHIEIKSHAQAGCLVIEIADNGPGIPEAERARVFEAFFFRREGGVGLGLAIVQQIVAAHGGTIQAGASSMGGALFSIRLPRKIGLVG